ncbi:MAG: LptF/LptG family permease [Candidatus Gastranaerophilales bacterium]|nr:LptF/LptG family permease [Candidatus Gastranaerophilales bacterium]
MKVKLLDKYILSQVFWTCFGCVFVFMIIWIMPEILLKTVQRTISGQYSIETAISIILFELPKVLNIALPVGMLIGSIITFDKLSKDFEITVMRGSGFPFFRIIISVIILSVFVSGFTFFVGSRLLPFSACKLKDIKGENRISQFVFPVKNSDDTMNKILIVSNFDNNNIKDVIVLNFYDRSEKGSSLLSSIIVSDYIKYDYNSWTINTAKKYLISKKGVFEKIENIKNYKVLENHSAINAYKLMRYSVNKDRELTNTQMSEYIRLLKQEKMDDEYRFMLNKYIQRFVHALMCVLFAILGCLLGFSQPREQKFLGLLIAVCIIFAYYITMPFFDMLAEKAVLSPWVTALIAPVCASVLIIILKRIKDL